MAMQKQPFRGLFAGLQKVPLWLLCITRWKSCIFCNRVGYKIAPSFAPVSRVVSPPAMERTLSVYTYHEAPRVELSKTIFKIRFGIRLSSQKIRFVLSKIRFGIR